MIALLLACCLSAPPEVTVDTQTLTMGAIIDFPPGDARTAIALGAAPQPGLGRRFYKPELLAKISTAGQPSGDLQFPESVLVRRKSQTLDLATIAPLVRDAFVRHFPDADITLISVDIPDAPLATGPLEISASVPDHSDPSQPVFVALDVRAPGFSRKVFAKTVVEVRKPQPTLRAAVMANQEIHMEDLEWKVLPMKGREDAVLGLDSLTGMLAKRPLAAGEVLTGDLLYAPLLVHKGESVTVTASNRGVTITATMRAKASARYGETIVVEHLTGTGSTSARVIGPRTLEATQGAR